MTTESNVAPERSYGCTFGCGNPYDYVIIDVRSGTTEFLCLPDFVHLASDIVDAATNASTPKVAAALAYGAQAVMEAAPGPRGRAGRHNAPTTNDDPDIFESYDAAITADELPDEFK